MNKIKAITYLTVVFCYLIINIPAIFAQDNNFKEVVQRIFSSNVIDSISYNNGKGIIIFKQNDDYFGTGDKINKIFAIESVRIFRDDQDIHALQMVIPISKKIYMMNVNKTDIELFYNINITDLSNNPETWRINFINKYDNKNIRKMFVAKFAVIN
jgi:hypothetical protein